MTETAGVMVFRCDALRSKLTIASCASNYRAANGGGKAPPTDALRKGLYPRQAGLRPCVGCALGAEHAETGKARSWLHLTVLRSDASAAPSAAPVVSKPFEDVKPEPAVAAVPPEAPSVPPTPVSVPRSVADVPQRNGLAIERMPRDAIVSELRSIVAERAKAEPKRGTPWSERAMELAVLLAEKHGAKQRELEDIGLNYFTVRGWARAAKAASGKTAQEIAAEGHAAKGGVPPEVRVAAIDRLLNGEHPSDVARALGVSEESVRRWRRDARIEKRKAARELNQAVGAAPKSTASEPQVPVAIPYERPMPIDDEPDVKVDPLDQMRAEQIADGIPWPSRSIAIDEDEIVDLCDRAGLGYRETTAVLALLMRDPISAFRILSRVINRLGAA